MYLLLSQASPHASPGGPHNFHLPGLTNPTSRHRRTSRTIAPRDFWTRHTFSRSLSLFTSSSLSPALVAESTARYAVVLPRPQLKFPTLPALTCNPATGCCRGCPVRLHELVRPPHTRGARTAADARMRVCYHPHAQLFRLRLSHMSVMDRVRARPPFIHHAHECLPFHSTRT